MCNIAALLSSLLYAQNSLLVRASGKPWSVATTSPLPAAQLPSLCRSYGPLACTHGLKLRGIGYQDNSAITVSVYRPLPVQGLSFAAHIQRERGVITMDIVCEREFFPSFDLFFLGKPARAIPLFCFAISHVFRGRGRLCEKVL